MSEETETIETVQPTTSETPVKADVDLKTADEDALLSAIYRKVNAEEEPGKADEPPAKTNEKAGKADEDGPERDEKGRFLSKNPELRDDETADDEADEPIPEKTGKNREKPAEAKADDEASEEADETADDEAKPQVRDKEAKGEFRGWTAEKRAKFEKLDDGAKEFVLAHQKDLQSFATKREREFAAFKKTADPYMEVIGRGQRYLETRSQEIGTTPQQLLVNLMEHEATLRWGTMAEKVALLQDWAKAYGVPAHFVDEDSAAAPDEPGGTSYAKLHDLAQENARLRAQAEYEQRLQQERHQQSIAAEIDDFRLATDADGSLLHPHFELVRHRMSELIRTGAATTFQDAYDKALAPLLQADASQQAARRKGHLQSAQRAARLNVTTAPLPVQKYASEDDALASAYRSAMAR